MTDEPRNPDMDELRRELHAAADPGPARLEMERRRLLARLDSERTGRLGERRGPGLRLALAGAAAVVILAAILTITLAPGIPAAPEPLAPIAVTGLVRLEPGDALTRGAPLLTPEDGGAKLLLPHAGGALWIGPGSELHVEEAGGSRLRLIRGHLLAGIAPRPAGGGDFRVCTPHGVIIVESTVFAAWSADDRSGVRLHEGAVRLKLQEESITVHPGHEVEVDDGGTLAMREVRFAGRLADLALADGIANLPGPPFPAIDPIRPDPTPPRPAPVPEATDAATGAPPRAPARHAERSRPVDAGTAAPLVGPDDLEVAVLPASSATAEQPDAAPIESGDLAARLGELVHRGRFFDAAAAAEDYLATQPTGPHAEDALFYKGYCRARAGDDETGRAALREYTSRFPEGRYWRRVNELLGE